MKKHLLATVVALAIGGSANAEVSDPFVARLVGRLGEASQKCGAGPGSRYMFNLSVALLNLAQHEGITHEESARLFEEGAMQFDNEAATSGLRVACEKTLASGAGFYDGLTSK